MQALDFQGDFVVLASLFGKKGKALLGVDISSTSVKVLELSHSDAGYRVEAYASEPLPNDAIVEQNIHNDEEVGEAIKRALTKSRSSASKAALAVAGSAVITKNIQMNANLNDAEMDIQIRAEADQYIPYPLEEVSLDWEIQGTLENNEGVVDVLLAACRSETVERRKDAVEYADLEAAIVDIEAYCTERAFELIKPQLEDESQQTVAIIDIGATMTTLSVLHNGASIYTREQLFGGNQLIEDIMRRYGLNHPEAMLAKTGDGLPPEFEQDVLEPFRNAVLQQISRSLQFFFSSSPFNEVNSIVLAGGTAALDGLAEKVSEEMGMPTLVANPFRDMAVSSKVNVNVLSADAPSLLVACGLAMRGSR
ncbi:pilus assembly protein PilM [Oceanobacter kriegii]|uniref:pilus assembly protein PilM n=1 Tax=Oceanobacter kriegii TaxID=64972 RepID=UPI000687A131|nr:pilus assembly protein PilM [Oceanobacter kriegii]